MNLIEAKVQCPYCWELLTVFVEPDEPEQQYVEDCHVCCAPMLLSVAVNGDQVESITAEQENG